MTKRRRQRGSRTHGGGSHKNRRGAGNRGGRGKAGRSNHEFHKQESRGKHGFNRPEKAKEEVISINIQELDEDIEIYRAEGLAKETEEGIWIDIREIVEDAYEADIVKLLGGGQLRHTINAVVDDFSQDAYSLIQEQGGNIYLSERSPLTMVKKRVRDRYKDSNKGNNQEVEKRLERYAGKVEEGTPLEFYEVEDVLKIGEEHTYPDKATDILKNHYRLIDDLSALDAVNLFQTRSFMEKYGIDHSELDAKIDGYFDPIDTSDERRKQLQKGVPSSLDIDDVLEGLDYIQEKHQKMYGDDIETRERRIAVEERKYLFAVEDLVDWF
ncbi:50S ribosomal protein L15 [Natrinema sp. 1APR25-10V2]|nr:uL15 family ribosomal protein [Natrinema sp. 1APR25-10V2]MDS0476823.1 50S ribosomal protein L15 [Natrinema sp. 1APR25-10V2]